jgi:hypothetical protein
MLKKHVSHGVTRVILKITVDPFRMIDDLAQYVNVKLNWKLYFSVGIISIE